MNFYLKLLRYDEKRFVVLIVMEFEGWVLDIGVEQIIERPDKR